MFCFPYSRRALILLIACLFLISIGWVLLPRPDKDPDKVDLGQESHEAPTVVEPLQPELILDASRTEVWRTSSQPRFLIRLQAGQFARVFVEQQGIDLVVEVHSGQSILFEVDSPEGRDGTEEVFLLGDEQATVFSLALRPLSLDESPDVTYRIAVEELRKATITDQQRYEAEVLFHRARVVQEKRLPELDGEVGGDLLRAAKLFRGLGERKRLADALFLHGKLLENAHEYEMAVQSYRESIEAFELADAQVQLGNAYMSLGKWDESRRAYHRALDLYDGGGGADEATAWGALGDLERRRGYLEEASQHLQKGYEMILRTGSLSRRLAILNSMGALYLSQGTPGRALPLFQQVLQEAPEGDTRTRYESLVLLADFYLSLHNLEKAQEYYKSAQELAIASHSRRKGILLVGLGRVAEERGDLTRALALFEQALEIFEGLIVPLDAAITRNNMAWLYLEQDETARARELFQEVLKDVEVLGDSFLRGVLHYGLARAARMEGDLEQAEEQIQSAIEAVELLRTRSPFKDRVSVFASRHDVFSFYIDLLMEQHDTEPAIGFEQKALGVAEQSKARALLDVLAQREGQGENFEEDSQWAMNRYLEQVSSIQERELRQLRRNDLSEETIATVQAGLRRTVEELATTQEELTRRYPKIAAVRFPRSLALPTILDSLTDTETVVMTYHLGRRRSYLWVVRQGSLHSFELEDPQSIEQIVQYLTELMERRRLPGVRQQIDSALSRIAKMILPSEEALIGVRRLVIVPSGELFRMPFAALPWPADEDPSNKALIESFEIVHLPSSSFLAAKRTNVAAVPQRRLAIFADPLFTREDERVASQMIGDRPSGRLDLPRLPASANEARAAESALRDPSNLVALGAAASRDMVAASGLADFSYLHFATHGIAHEKSPEMSYLVLSQLTDDGRWQDGRLTAREVATLKLSAELVVLSACRTGPGRPIRGEGLTGLARSFLLAGSRRVLVTQWTVDDWATAEMMRRFYTIHAGGTNIAAALRQAQLEMRRDSNWKDPYYWAGFILFGDWY